MQLDISRGIDPVLSHYDIEQDTLSFIIGSKVFRWETAKLPFTLIEIARNGHSGRYADAELVEKHGLEQ